MNLKWFCVFDGCDHPIKDETKASLCDERREAKDELFSFHECGKYQTEVLTEKISYFYYEKYKKIACRTNELVHLVKIGW